MAQTSPADEEDSVPAIGPATLLAGRYELEQRIGMGTYGEVWRAHDLRNRYLKVAVKLLRSMHTAAEVRRRFAQECAALELLMPHPHIVAIRDRGDFHGQDFMVLELLDGITLAEWLRQHTRDNPPDQKTALGLFAQICAGVAAAHRIQNPGPIVHRDIKPDNVMLVPHHSAGYEHCSAKLLDFGVARLEDQRCTVAGVRLGTPLYMSPEQALGDEHAIGPWSDVFSLGVLLVELLTLSPAGPEESSLRGAMTGKRSRGLLEHLRACRPDVSDPVWHIAMKALAPRPEDRYADAELLRNAVVSLPAATKPPQQVTDKQTKHHAGARRLLVGVSITVLAAGGLASWHALRSKVSKPTSAPVAQPAPLQPVPTLREPPAELPHRWLTGPTKLIQIPGGEFKMGSSSLEANSSYHWCRQLPGAATTPCHMKTYRREQPQHLTRVTTFWMEATEVTSEQFAAWLNTLEGLTFSYDKLDPEIPRYVSHKAERIVDLYPTQGGARGLEYRNGKFSAYSGAQSWPAVQLSWYAARDYCLAQGRRLPTEAEWEYAARTGQGFRFPWGFDDPRCGEVVFALLPGQKCHGTADSALPVGTSRQDRSYHGIYDLGGNVSEWVQDAFWPKYNSCPQEACQDPLLPVARGDAPMNQSHELGSTNRASSAVRKHPLLPGQKLANPS